MTDLPTIRSLLLQILQGREGELGARLKTRLQFLSEKSSGVRFDERAHGFGKFSDFLRANCDLFTIEPAQGSKDVFVRVRTNGGASPPPPVQVPPPLSVDRGPSGDVRSSRLPNQVWQAFANPDSRRRRYLNRRTFDVVHFLAPHETRIDEVNAQRVAAAPAEFVEIAFVTAEEQLHWIRDFLRTAEMPERERKTLDALFSAASYSSQLNTTFVAALGARADQWRSLRGSKIFERVRNWCREHDVSLDSLTGDGFSPNRPIGHPSVDHQTLHSLIDSLDQAELRSVLLPFGAIARFLDNARTKTS